MTVCWFASFRHASPDLAWLSDVIAATPGLQQGLIFTPSSASDPYLDDGPPPQLALQLYFNDIAALEAAMTTDGHLRQLSVLQSDGVTQQAMLVRRYPVPDPTFRTLPGVPPCTYLVAYEGAAEDLTAWLTEIYTCIDWCGGLPWPRVTHMQRNKVVFDNQAALTAALNSPVRHEMREAFHRFPSFTGPITHFPMETTTVMPKAG